MDDTLIQLENKFDQSILDLMEKIGFTFTNSYIDNLGSKINLYHYVPDVLKRYNYYSFTLCKFDTGKISYNIIHYNMSYKILMNLSSYLENYRELIVKRISEIFPDGVREFKLNTIGIC